MTTPKTCATEGCKGVPVVHFLRGDVGSHYCRDCYAKIDFEEAAHG